MTHADWHNDGYARPEDQLIGFVNAVSIAASWDEAFAAIGEPCQRVSNEYALRRDLDGQQPPESARLSLDDLLHSAETGEQVGFRLPNVGTVDQIIEKFLPIVRGERGLVTHIGFEVRPPERGPKTPTALCGCSPNTSCLCSSKKPKQQANLRHRLPPSSGRSPSSREPIVPPSSAAGGRQCHVQFD